MWLGGDAARAGRELDCWSPRDRVDRNVRAALRLRLALTPTLDAVLTRESLDRALAVTREALRDQWSSGVALSRAHLLVARHGRGESPDPWSPGISRDKRGDTRALPSLTVPIP